MVQVLCILQQYVLCILLPYNTSCIYYQLITSWCFSEIVHIEYLLLLLLLFSSSSSVTDMMTVDFNAPCCGWECDIVWCQWSAVVTLNWRKKPFVPPLFLSVHQFTYSDYTVSPWPYICKIQRHLYYISCLINMNARLPSHPFCFWHWRLAGR